MINNLNIQSYDYFSKNGFKNNLNYYLKNTISAGKNNIEYDSSPHIKFMNIFELVSSFPLINKVKIIKLFKSKNIFKNKSIRYEKL